MDRTNPNIVKIVKAQIIHLIDSFRKTGTIDTFDFNPPTGIFGFVGKFGKLNTTDLNGEKHTILSETTFGKDLTIGVDGKKLKGHIVEVFVMGRTIGKFPRKPTDDFFGFVGIIRRIPHTPCKR